MMWLTVDVFFCFVIAINIIRSVSPVHLIKKCSLLPSGLGPDWYKVHQPIPLGIDGKPAYEPSYIHMPCAQTTVFDIGVCGCTNLMSFIFTSVNRRKKINHEFIGSRNVDPHDRIKHLEESTTPRPPAASILINTRTGEVKECPFRASSRGPMWYLIREPRDNWRHMRCADGTLFEKRSCTCIHKQMSSREPEKPEDVNIIIIEEDIGGVASDKTISQSLGISVSDVDFSRDQRPQDIPFWRRQDLFTSNKKEEKRKFDGKSDVQVMLHDHGNNNGQPLEEKDGLGIGKDDISSAHKQLFLKGNRKGLVSHSRTKITPLVLDSTVQNKLDTDNSVHADGNAESLIIRSETFQPQTVSVRRGDKAMDEDNILKVLDEISTTIDALKNAEQITDPDKQNKTEDDEHTGPFDEIFYSLEECPKKPLQALGAQYFLLHVRNIGYIPFTCHGNTVYDHSICACKPVQEDTAYDEIKFPVKECMKRALPELGPQFFLDHLRGVGYIPYVCHGNRLYDENVCACV
ncbi:uncharacterized protein LOC123557442 [Mercenaria mercenaria]|uniref:uncharacterized protein LOC123557442 n=1 Tax=Mercenaria mercenaria TaxID=6596 RepID=UPI00234F0A56|nr:uncharacterized protein LOC123557442 [Mercenaria mercenaria]XP_045204833.2 uncharacterized protein LOC123557442 [Mercenaria mercenaria]XP_053399750.1 uncharacterized protein LOC123557442 [Mercenaria mercenaria]